MSDDGVIHLERRTIESMVTNNLQNIAILSGRISALEKTVDKLVKESQIAEETLCIVCGRDYDEPFVSDTPHTCPLCVGLQFAKERRLPPASVTRTAGEIWDA